MKRARLFQSRPEEEPPPPAGAPAASAKRNGHASAEQLRQEVAELRRAWQAAEERYASFYAFAPAAHLSFDEAGVLTELNLAAAQLLGLREPFPVGAPFSTFVEKADKVKFLDHLRRCETSQEKVVTELKLSRHGAPFTAQLQTEAVCWRSRWYRTVLIDLTERETVDRELRARETRFRALVENSAEAICVTDAHGVINYASPSTIHVIGYAPEEMLGQPGSRFFYDENLRHRQIRRRDFTGARERGKVEFLSHVRHKDGSLRWVEATITNLLGDPAVRGMVCNFRDITARKLGEEALQESEARYRVLTESIPQLVWVCDPTGELEFCNSPWFRYTGLALEQCADGGWIEIIHPEDRARVLAHWAVVKEQGTAGEIECRYRRAQDGAYRWHLVQISGIRDAGGHLVRWIGVASDIHERKEAEQAREKLFQRLQEERALLSVQYAVVRTVAECATLEEAAPQILRAFCENIGWHVGELWRVDAAAQRLRSVAIWSQPGVEATAFLEKTPTMTFAKGEGVAGRVWTRRRPVWLEDVTKTRLFRRAELAELGGLHAGFAFPILRQTEVLGVVEFFNREILKPQTALLKIVAAMGTQIGQFIERTTSRVALRDSQEALQRANDELEARVHERTLALQQANRELSGEIARRNRLEREILEISEREQRRLGQDLHDGLCQELAASACMARALSTRLKARDVKEADDLGRIAGHVNNAVLRARNVARGLHPVEMDAEGLMIALQDLAGRVSEEVACEFHCTKPVPVPESELALNLYRIAQEATTNALKHAAAQRVVISLERRNEKLILTITDDGRGLDKSRSKKPGGLGLHMMQYRARAIGASLAIQPANPRGTRLLCVLPLTY